MNSSFFGTFSNVSAGTSKFFASTSFGVCVIQSVSRNVSNSLKFPSSNTSRNVAPSGPSPWIECGIPPGKHPQIALIHILTNARPS